MQRIAIVIFKIILGFVIAYVALNLMPLLKSFTFILYFIALISCAYSGSIMTLFLNEISFENKKYAVIVSILLLINTLALFLLLNVYTEPLEQLANFDLALSIIAIIFMVIVFIFNIPLFFHLIKELILYILTQAKKDK